MANYSSKMRVFQNWGAPATGTVGEQNVFVFGPRYSLSRYTDEEEKSRMKPVPFESDGVSPVEIEGAITVLANYELKSLEVYAENAFVSVEALDNSETAVEGEYTDGKLLYNAKLENIKEGDYFYFVLADGASDKIRIQSVKYPKDDEYGTDWTEIELAMGLGDEFENGIPEGSKLFVARAVSSAKLEDTSFENAGENVTVNPEAAVTIKGVSYNLLAADLYMSTKMLYTGTSPGIQLASGVSEVEKVLGAADPDNPLSLGVYNAFVGGASAVYYYETEGDSVAAFEKALERATLNSTLYYLVPMSQDPAVITAVVRHIGEMSTEDVKRWRICVACLPADKSVVTDDDELEVVGCGTYMVKGVAFKTLKFSKDVSSVVDGDTIVVDGTVFIAARILNKTTVLTQTRADAADVTGKAVITHVRTETEYVKAVAAAAKSVGTFRFVDVFPKTYGFAGDTYNSMYLAPIIAGMAAAVEPQAPITNATVPGVDDLPDIYNGYSAAQLDEIASGGVLIVAQDQAGERCYVRKQLTTGTSGGVLAQTELSMVKNYDSISHFFDTILEGFKGGYNVTDGILQRVWTELNHGVYVLQNNSTDPAIGPQLLESSAVQKVEIDPANRTKINAYIDCDLPAPFNDMDLFLSVVTTEVAAITPEA